MRVVIAEKPSVAKSIAHVLGANKNINGYWEGNGYAVSSNLGHLFELKEAQEYNPDYEKWDYDDLPIIPPRFEYKIKNDGGIKKQFKILKELLNRPDVTEIINAGDAGREGELIFRLTYNMSGSKKPVKRLWLSSMEDESIKKGFTELKPGSDYDNLYKSALGRQQADWLVGITGTRLYSVLYREGGTKKLGRVQSPTLAMIVNRDNAIKNFVKTDYWKSVAVIHKDNKEFLAYTDRIDDKEEALRISERIKNGSPLNVKEVKTEDHKAGVPHLYDLTSLQKDASELFGLDPAETLEALQSLYEQKLATYPRTDSQYLTDDMEETAREVLKAVEAQFSGFHGGATNSNPNIKSHLNSSKVTDHHAIIPTKLVAGISPNVLKPNEKLVLSLISERLIEAFDEPEIYKTTEILFDNEGTEFKSKGKIILSKGWKGKRDEYKQAMTADPEEAKDKNEDKVDQELPTVNKGEVLKDVTSEVKTCETTAPKHFNDSTILSAMENAGADEISKEVERKGLGTSATRAEILKKLEKDGYVEKKGKNLIATQKGIDLINLLPEDVKSPQLTAEWENKLLKVSDGSETYENFMEGIKGYVKKMVSDQSPKAKEVKEKRETYYDKPKDHGLGVCPKCGAPLQPSKFGDAGWCPSCWKKQKEEKEAQKKTEIKEPEEEEPEI